MFMVKKLVDEEKGEMPRIFEKECKGLFINASRFEMYRCSWTQKEGILNVGESGPKPKVLLPKVQKDLQFKFQVFRK